MARITLTAAAATVALALAAAGIGGGVGAGDTGPAGSTRPRAPTPTPNNPRLRDLHTFALAIGTGDLDGDLAARYRGYDLVVVDGQEATRAQVAELHRTARVVLGYLDVGTIEPERPWFARARAYRLDRWRQWGEWYADTSKAGYRRLVAGAVAPRMLAKGFDGLFLDNVDEIESHPQQAAGMRALVRTLAQRVHSSVRLLFAQNGADVLRPLTGVLDGWNREDVSFTYDAASHAYRATTPAEHTKAQAELRAMSAAGLLVTATDYLPLGPSGAPDATSAHAATSNACAAGALPFISDIGLERIRQPPLRCTA